MEYGRLVRRIGSYAGLGVDIYNGKGYKNGYSPGMNAGTDKTAEGNPDTYFLTANNEYIFVMYTTQKTDFIKKAIEAIDKYFDSEKAGVPVDDVTEVVYCHTYGRLKPSDDQHLREYCENYGATPALMGLDELGNDVFCKYSFLSKDFLAVSIDSGQILPLDIFIKKSICKHNVCTFRHRIFISDSGTAGSKNCLVRQRCFVDCRTCRCGKNWIHTGTMLSTFEKKLCRACN